MRKGREGLAGIVREVMGHNPKCYDEAFIFYSKDYKKVKILHYDLNGYVMYQKWFDNGKFLKPEFTRIQNSHEISRETLIFFAVHCHPDKDSYIIWVRLILLKITTD